MTARPRRLAAALAVLAGTALAGTVAALPAGALPGVSSPAGVSSPPAVSSPARPAPVFTLTVLHTNDGESSLLPRTVGGVEYGGIARFVTTVQTLRDDARFGRPPAGQAHNRGAVTLNSGDNFLAGLAFEASRQPGAPFYDAEAVEDIGYDVLAVGNHEFDFGPAVFGEFVRGVGGDVPFVSANLGFGGSPDLAPLVGDRLFPSAIVRTNGRDIGVVGLTTPTLRQISSPGPVTVDPDLRARAQEQIDRLRARGVDIVIVQSHLQGIGSELALVPQLSGVDVVIGGGGGELLADPAQGDRIAPGDENAVFGSYPQVAVNADGQRVPVVTTDGNYEYVGRLVVNFDRRGNVLGWDEQASGPQLVTSSGPGAVRENRVTKRDVQDPVAAFVAEQGSRVLATSEVDLQCQRAEVRGGESNCGNLLADSMLAEARERAAEFGAPQAQVAVQNGGGIRGEVDVPAGPFSVATAFQLAAFSTNFVSVAPDVPAETFRQLLEEGVSSLPDGGFAQAAGFRYTVDLTRQARVTSGGVQTVAGQRVRDVVLDDGTVVVADGVAVAGVTVDVASNDFSLAGGDSYPAVPFVRLGSTYTQALVDYVSEDLGGVIRAADYPVAGEGRITITR